jgi:hypothetical protein
MPDYDPKSIPILDDVIKADILEQAEAEDKHKAPIADITDIEDELSVDDGTINIFSTAPVELSPEDAIIEDSSADAGLINDLDESNSGPSIGALDSLDSSPADAIDDTSPVNTDENIPSHHIKANTEDSDTEYFEEESYESALIDYRNDADIVQEASDQPTPAPGSEAQQAGDEPQTGTEEVADSVIEQSPSPVETQTTQATQETQATQATMVLALDNIVDDVVNDIVSQLIPDLQQQLRYLVQQALEDRLPAEIISQQKSSSDQGDS